MQKIVDELKKILPLKETTTIGDTIIIVAKEPQMLLYAHIDDIERDTSRKDEWWHVQLSMLTIPLQKVTWTLRTEQISGQEIFTMGGEERFIQALDFKVASVKDESSKNQTNKKEKKTTQLKRVK
ncbi:MAG: hypothetical protein ACI8ZB_001483 [Desulforhopalus sp.]|jgi:hypothetical protein